MKSNKNKSTKQERVQVSVRIRPFNELEKQKDPSTPIKSIDLKNNFLQIQKGNDTKDIKSFKYDHIYSEDSKQETIFEETSKNVVQSALNGFNGTILAYGQTGTGKTYTMIGSEKNKGIIPRAFDYIFESVKQDSEHEYNIKISFIEIYKEHIQDLIDLTKKDIRIRESPEEGFFLEGVTWVKINNTSEFVDLFTKCEKNRTTESTTMNKNSSRSHAILIAKIEKKEVFPEEKLDELRKENEEKINAERVMTNSYLYLVDLAGSERVKKTNAVEIRLEEAIKINLSLLSLGNCINFLSEGKTHLINYRESILTKLLKESLGGNSKASLIVTVSPSSYNSDETVSSLNFGKRAMKVKNNPIKNIRVDYHNLYIKLKEDYDNLIDKYDELEKKYEKIKEENKKLKSSENDAEFQKKNLNQNLEDNNDNVNNKKFGINDLKELKKMFKEEENKKIKKLTKNLNAYKEQNVLLKKKYENEQKINYGNIDKLNYLYEKIKNLEIQTQSKKSILAFPYCLKDFLELGITKMERRSYHLIMSNKNDYDYNLKYIQGANGNYNFFFCFYDDNNNYHIQIQGNKNAKKFALKKMANCIFEAPIVGVEGYNLIRNLMEKNFLFDISEKIKNFNFGPGIHGKPIEILKDQIKSYFKINFGRDIEIE